MSWAVAAVTAGLYGVKSLTVDKDKENRQRHLRAEEERYSPWSGLKNFQQVEEADPLGATLGGAAQGMGLSQGFQAADEKNDLNKQLIKKLNGPDVAPPESVGPISYNTWLKENSASQPAAPQKTGFLNQSKRGMLDDYYGF